MTMDGLIAVSGLGFPAIGILDVPAHVATGLIVLATCAPRSGPWVAAFWLGAVGIDLDHLPLLIGSDALSQGTGRPYTHSLLTVVVALALALVWPRVRPVAPAFALGLLSHFSRDLATGSGVSLLRPISDEQLTIPYPVWLGVVVVIAAGSFAADTRRAPREETGQPRPRVGIGETEWTGR